MSSDEEDWRTEVSSSTSRFKIGDHEFVVEQMDELPLAASLFMLAEMHEQSTEISGLRVWAGSHLLAYYLLENNDIVKGKNVIELGAGTGLGSMLSTKLNAANVVATDGDEEAIEMLQRNLERNNCAMKCCHLYWGDENSWNTFHSIIDTSFQVVIAGDVLYKKELLQPFFDTVCRIGPVQLVLCHIPRADVSHAVIEDTLKSYGFDFTSIIPSSTLSELPQECPVEDVDRARIYRVTINT